MFEATLIARPFDCEEDAIAAVLSHKIQPGDAVFIRYEGPQGSGMPEMFYTTEAIASDEKLGASIALRLLMDVFLVLLKDLLLDMFLQRQLREDQLLWLKKEI